MLEIYTDLNNGVYRARFAASQEAYEAGYDAVFRRLDAIEDRVSDGRRILFGDRLTEADVRLITTLVRFDAVYHNHFRCNRNKITEMPAVWAYARRVFQTSGFGDSGSKAGDTVMGSLTAAMRAVISDEIMPAWTGAMPGAAPSKLPRTTKENAAAVYFPACINRIFGNSRSSTRTLSLPQALVAVSARAGLPLWIPDDVAGTCCITVWHSKGYVEAARFMAERTADRFWVWSDGGRLPIIVDATSCTLGAGRELLQYLDDADVAATSRSPSSTPSPGLRRNCCPSCR